MISSAPTLPINLAREHYTAQLLLAAEARGCAVAKWQDQTSHIPPRGFRQQVRL